MKQNKFIRVIIAITIVTLYIHSNISVTASEKISDASAQIDISVSSGSVDSEVLKLKKLVITKILSKNSSPLLSNADSFVKSAARYDLDPYLLPSITWLESSLGKNLIERTKNPFGWGGGLIAWKSYDEGIETVARGLRTNYINKGAKDVYDIGRIYASSPTWALRVEKFMVTFYNEEQSVIKMRDAVSKLEST